MAMLISTSLLSIFILTYYYVLPRYYTAVLLSSQVPITLSKGLALEKVFADPLVVWKGNERLPRRSPSPRLCS